MMTHSLPPGAVLIRDKASAPNRVLVPVYDMTTDSTGFYETDRKVLDFKWGPKEAYAVAVKAE